MAEGGAGAGGGGAAAAAAVVKEGKLFKRGDNYIEEISLYLCLSFSLYLCLCMILSGEHIKNWRERYFILKEDGQVCRASISNHLNIVCK